MYPCSNLSVDLDEFGEGIAGSKLVNWFPIVTELRVCSGEVP